MPEETLWLKIPGYRQPRPAFVSEVQPNGTKSQQVSENSAKIGVFKQKLKDWILINIEQFLDP